MSDGGWWVCIVLSVSVAERNKESYFFSSNMSLCVDLRVGVHAWQQNTARSGSWSKCAVVQRCPGKSPPAW